MNVAIHRFDTAFSPRLSFASGPPLVRGNIHMLHVDPLEHQPRRENITDENIVSGEKI
jgi:hypothetical protein